MPERKWILGAAIAVAVVLVVGALLTRGSDSGSGAGALASASRDETGSAGVVSLEGSGSVASTGSAAVGSAIATAPPGFEPRFGGTAPDRAELVTVTTAPAGTLAIIAGDEAAEGDRFRVSFRPYGWGPARQSGRALVIRVDSASRAPQNSAQFELQAGQNALVIVPLSVAHRIGDGGQYTGTIVLRSSAGALALHLEQAAGAVP